MYFYFPKKSPIHIKKYGANPKQVGKLHIKELRSLIGFDNKKLVNNPSKSGH